MFAGSAALGLAFTSAVAAEVVSGGRIEIPVAHQLVEAVPILKATAQAREPKTRLASAEKVRHAPAATAVQPDAPAADSSAELPRERLAQRFEQAKRRVAERRAAGLPTPYADRLERRAERIVAQRQAAGLPTPSVDEVEKGLVIRQARERRQRRLMARDPSIITDPQIQQVAERLSPERRERFLSLSPQVQRRLIARRLQRMRQPDGTQQGSSENAQPVATAEPQTEQPAEGFSEQPR